MAPTPIELAVEKAKALLERLGEVTHLYSSRSPTETLCGEPGRAMPWHEIKRYRINCGPCLVRFIEQER